YLFVDEFQDCSPIQIKLFTELSELVEHSYWVGDYKQSIYGFRGTDIDMVKAVKEGIDKDHVHTLGTSYRSLPPIVDVNNHLFTKLFANQLQPEEVEMNAHRDKNPLLNSLWYNIIENQTGLNVHCIEKLLDKGVKPSDIAILSRVNATLEKIAAELHELGIASCLGQKELANTETWILVKSLLCIVDNPDDTLARAQVALLTDPRYCTREIIKERLLNNSDSTFLSDVPLVGKLLAMRDTLRIKSVVALVEQMVIELGLPQVVKQVEEDPTVGTDCLQGILASARKYL
ncbi:MAG: UvrD-helicase domain-containing protein, partial [Clostridia bacterium]|nr:UvrD-helicase domain-containing protein [Clostridia bacterium]